MRILLIEDDLVIADLINKGLREAGFSVKHANEGLTGVSHALSGEFDLAIVDLMLPKLDGLSIIDLVRDKKINLPILILSAKRSVEERVSGLTHGGDDYLTKPFSFSELLARVHALIRRSNNVIEPATMSYQDLTLDLLARTVNRAGKKVELQPKEFALLEYLVRNQGHVVSKTMIMERVWDYHFDPGTNVVQVQMTRLRRKIEEDPKYPRYLQTVRGTGYVLMPD